MEEPHATGDGVAPAPPSRHGAASASRTRRSLLVLVRRPLVAIALVFVLTLGGAAAVAAVLGMPTPRGHDEHSYLLLADTIAHGRLANPAHPMWEHFESFHVIHQPTYASKYPPAPGLLLAAGQVLVGAPAAGVWLGAALMGAAITWMLLAWVPPRWAFVGGLLAVILLGVTGRWAQGFYGGAVAATGGALVYGALRRILREPRVASAVVMGIGLLILANSRPWEGMLASLPAAGVMAVWLAGRGRPRLSTALGRVVLPLALVLALGATAMGRYHQVVTGSPFTLPYMVHEAEYGVAPLFVWQAPRPEPAYRHERLREFHTGWELEQYERRRTPAGYVQSVAWMLAAQAFRYVGPVLILPALVMLPFVLRRRWPRLAAGAIAIVLASLAVTSFYAGHYSAPITGLVIYLLVESLRHLRAAAPRGGRRWVVPAALALCAAAQVPATMYEVRRTRQDVTTHDDLAASLAADGRRHLVIVHYDADFPPHSEWVYNTAAIDEQTVVWARSMGAERDQRLVDHFADRQAWRLNLRAMGKGELGPWKGTGGTGGRRD